MTGQVKWGLRLLRLLLHMISSLQVFLFQIYIYYLLGNSWDITPTANKPEVYRFSNGTICAFLELYSQVKVFQQQNTEYWRTEKPGSVIITVKNVQHEVLYCSRILIESFDDKFIAVRGVIDGLFLEYSYFVLKLFQFFPSLLVLCFLSHFMRNV